MAKVLIIEDDDVIAQGMARHLQAAGFDAVGVANGETGLARLRFEHPDVCVLDLMLPGLTGVDLYTAAVMKRPELASRFVFISGGSFAAGTLEFFDRVRNPVLRKPMSPTELRDVLRQVVSSAQRGPGG